MKNIKLQRKNEYTAKKETKQKTNLKQIENKFETNRKYIRANTNCRDFYILTCKC